MRQFRKLTSLLCAVALLIAALCLPAMAETSAIFAGGSGTTENPWQIATVEQLTAFAASVNDGSQSGYAGQSVVLTSDIDLAGVDWTPIGNMEDMEGHTTIFLGTFDGAGHTVSNLIFETDAPIVGAGLFGLNVGEIKNVNMTNATVTCTDGTSQAIAALVGYNMGAVSGCTVTGVQATGNACVGGVIGGMKLMKALCAVTCHKALQNNHPLGDSSGQARLRFMHARKSSMESPSFLCFVLWAFPPWDTYIVGQKGHFEN